MKTKLSRSSGGAGKSAGKAKSRRSARSKKTPMLGAAGRLARLKAEDMPWLSPEGLQGYAGVPEVSGAVTYKKPPSWR